MFVGFGAAANTATHSPPPISALHPRSPAPQVGGAVERVRAAPERVQVLWSAQGAGALRQDLAVWRRALQDKPGGVHGKVQGARASWFLGGRLVASSTVFTLPCSAAGSTHRRPHQLGPVRPGHPPAPDTPPTPSTPPPRSTSGCTWASPAGRAPAQRCPTSSCAWAATRARAAWCASTTRAPTRLSPCASTARVSG